MKFDKLVGGSALNILITVSNSVMSSSHLGSNARTFPHVPKTVSNDGDQNHDYSHVDHGSTLTRLHFAIIIIKNKYY